MNKNQSRPRRRPSSSRGGSSRVSGDYRRRRSRGRRSPRKMPTFDPSQFINKNPVEMKQEVYQPKHTFGDFGIDERIVKIVHDAKITIPSPIQDQAIPEVMKGHDVVGLAETGTGKTAAFLLPIIHKTIKNPAGQTLILAPTRELAIQINQELRKLSHGMYIFSVTCVGGMNINPQIRTLKRKNHFIIATPGRVLDLMNRGHLKTDKINTVILDEADRMLDMGFIHDMRKILGNTPDTRQTLFFSATMNKAAESLVGEFLKKPATISVKKTDTAKSIEQDVVMFNHSDKFKTLTDLLNKDEFSRVIVFGAMKHSVEKLSKELTRAGIRAESIHGNKSHSQRQRALKNFKDARAKVLVATDVAARGIHVDDVSHVINYDLPQTFDDYVHRIGRTGRGTKRGKALTFIDKTSMNQKSEAKKSPRKRHSRRKFSSSKKK